MASSRTWASGRKALRAACAAAAVTGCAHFKSEPILPVADVPKELAKASLPAYVIEPPDILEIDLLAAVPKPPYKVQALDALFVKVTNAFPAAPIDGIFAVDPDGTINLGAAYGTVQVRGLTLDAVKSAVRGQLAKELKDPQVAEVSLAQTRGLQQVRGTRLVQPDGTVGLGSYGSVWVAGLTVPAAKQRVEEHLSQFFLDPEVSIALVGLNSKVYYVVFDGAGAGQQVSRLPSTGNETVLDAVSQLGGLIPVADLKHIQVARPGGPDCPQIVLPVDWHAITEQGDVATNYQLLPGDRVFIGSLPLAKYDVVLGRLLAPFERIFGFSLLGIGVFNNNRNNNSVR